MIWDVETGGEIMRFEPSVYLENDPILTCRFAPDGGRVLTTGLSSRFFIWDLEEKRELQISGHAGTVNSCAFDPDGRKIVSCSGDGTLRLWEARTGGMVRVFADHPGSIQTCSFGPDGRLVVSGGADGLAKIWEVEA
jgi:WD40 repeat protein